MPDSLLTILKFLLVILIWLFFLRAMRTAWVEIRRPKKERPAPPRVEAPAPRRREPAGQRLRLRVLEPDDYRDKVFNLGDELTMGRAEGCGVALDYDTFASKVHARLFRRSGELWIEDLNSTNGTYVNAERIASPVQLERGDRVQVGQTVLEVTR